MILQEQEFEHNVTTLRKEFSQVDPDQVHHCLETAQGRYDVAYSMLLEDADYLVMQVRWHSLRVCYSERVTFASTCL